MGQIPTRRGSIPNQGNDGRLFLDHLLRGDSPNLWRLELGVRHSRRVHPRHWLRQLDATTHRMVQTQSLIRFLIPGRQVCHLLGNLGILCSTNGRLLLMGSPTCRLDDAQTALDDLIDSHGIYAA